MRALTTIRGLASGRLPPLTRTALLAAALVSVLAVVLFEPQAGSAPPALALQHGVRLVPPGDSRTESVVLLDTSAVYFPSKSSLGGAGQGRIGQPEDTPFSPPTAMLQLNPSKQAESDSSLQVPRQTVPQAVTAIPLTATEPLTTFGGKGYTGSGMEPRLAYFKVIPVSGSNKAILSGNITQFSDKKDLKPNLNHINHPFITEFIAILGVDSFGKGPIGAIQQSSGSPALDDSIRRWAGQIDWGGRLPSGVYLLSVGP